MGAVATLDQVDWSGNCISPFLYGFFYQRTTVRVSEQFMSNGLLILCDVGHVRYDSIGGHLKASSPNLVFLQHRRKAVEFFERDVGVELDQRGKASRVM